MAQSKSWRLKHYVEGSPRVDDFELVSAPIADLKADQVRVKSLFLSIDPFIRGLLSAKTRFIVGLPAPIALGDVIPATVVAEVVESRHKDYKVGERLVGMFGWQEQCVFDASGKDPISVFNYISKVDPKVEPLSLALSALGFAGLTAYFGVFNILKAWEGEQLLISSAAGAVGQIVGQIGRILGCYVVGMAGTDEKCAYLVDELGFNEAINYRTSKDLHQDISTACPRGVDMYFDNVGGVMLEQALHHINRRARIALCGMTSEYNVVEPVMVPSIARLIFVKEASIQGLMVYSYEQEYPKALAQLILWYQSGQLIYKEDIRCGFELAPQTLIALLEGKHFGKTLVKV